MNISWPVLAALILGVILVAAMTGMVGKFAVDEAGFKLAEADRRLAEADAKLQEAEDRERKAAAKLAEADAKLAEEAPENVAAKLAEAAAKLKQADEKMRQAEAKLSDASLKLEQARNLEAEAGENANREAQAARDALATEQKNSEFKLALVAVASETEDGLAELLQEAEFCLQHNCPNSVVKTTLHVLDDVEIKLRNQCVRLGEEIGVSELSMFDICSDFTSRLFGDAANEVYYALDEKYPYWWE